MKSLSDFLGAFRFQNCGYGTTVLYYQYLYNYKESFPQKHLF